MSSHAAFVESEHGIYIKEYYLDFAVACDMAVTNSLFFFFKTEDQSLRTKVVRAERQIETSTPHLLLIN